jgi:hypothetical protein
VEDDSSTRIGDISLDIWYRARARLVNQTPIDHISQNNPGFRQGMRLDYSREQQRLDPAAQEWGEVPIRWNNSDPGSIRVHLPTLRKLLGLPMYPLFDRDIFNDQPRIFPSTVAKIWRTLIMHFQTVNNIQNRNIYKPNISGIKALPPYSHAW